MLKKSWRAAVVATGAVLIAAACGVAGDDDEAGQNGDQAAAEQAESAEVLGDDAGQTADGPDLSDIPDPVAEVNGTEISRDEFVSVFENQYQQMSMQAQMSGQPVDEEQLKELAADGLVGTELLLQEAESRDLEASDDEIQAELARFAETNQVSEDEFIAAMGEQGMDRDEVIEQIERQLIVEKLLIDEYGEFTATDAEIEAAYQEVADQQAAMGGMGGQAGGELPPLEDVRDEVEEQIIAENQAEAMETLSQELRADADVTVFL